MATAQTIIERAFRKIGVKAEDEGLTADQLAYGLEMLNAMLHGWELWGVDIGHVDYATTGTFALPAKFEEGTVWLLAERLAPDYSVPAGFSADDFLRRVQAAYMVIYEAALPLALRRTSSQQDFGHLE
jgi:hypothetical protein